MGKLADLAARCLELKVLSRAMDTEIDRAVSPDDPQWKSYTYSIDAALTLVPKGWRWLIEHFDGEYSASVNSGNGFDTLGVAEHPTSPALALCAATLRARDLVEGAGA